MEIAFKRNEKLNDITFPILMESPEVKLVVWFIDKHTGFCVSKGSTIWAEGSFSTNWDSAYNPQWKKVEKGSEITLKFIQP